jgi:excisionase family DNA binding protein
MRGAVPYGQGTRMLSLAELCEWLNITERHARKLVERGAIPYRKIGHLLRFPEAEIEEWSHPEARKPLRLNDRINRNPAIKRGRARAKAVLPKSLIE